MPTEKEEKQVRSAKERTLEELNSEISEWESLSKSVRDLGDLIIALRRAHDPTTDMIADQYQAAYDALLGKLWRESNMVAGKQEARHTLVQFPHVSLEGARNLIDDLIANEKAQAIDHATKAVQLVQAQHFGEAASEFQAAVKELHKIAGKEKVKLIFY